MDLRKRKDYIGDRNRRIRETVMGSMIPGLAPITKSMIPNGKKSAAQRLKDRFKK